MCYTEGVDAKGGRIRNYQSGDRAAVREICWYTAMLGEPFPAGKVCRQTLVDLLLEPYLRLQPEAAWVCLDEQQRVVGYLAGNFGRYFSWRSLPLKLRALVCLLYERARGRGDDHLPFWLVFRSWREQPPSPPGVHAHFHFNLRASHRSQGYGSACLERFERALQGRGLRDLYARAFCRPQGDDEGLWLHLGFQEYSRHPTSLFHPYLGAMDWVCFGKEL